MMLADVVIANSVSGVISLVFTIVFVPSVGWYVKRRVDSADAVRSAQTAELGRVASLVDDLENRMHNAEDHRERCDERAERVTDTLGHIGQTMTAINTALTAHLEWSASENGYLRSRLDRNA